MSRSGYHEDWDDQWGMIMYRGRVASAIRGRRGQRLLLDLVRALDGLPVKRLITGELEQGGDVCALGAVGRLRGIQMGDIDPEDPSQVSNAFDIAECLAREIVFENDEAWPRLTPEKRWESMRSWAVSQLLPVDLKDIPE